MLFSILSFFLMFCAQISEVWASGDCPAKVSADPSNPVAYVDRGDRCEGLFREQVAASAQLSLIGVHRHAPDFAPGSGRPLSVASPSALKPGQALSIRALSSRPRLYYRMDAKMASGARFIWKRDVIDNPAVMLKPGDIKALLCERSCAGAEPKIFPISIAEAQAPPTKGITLWFRAAVDLRQLFVTIQREPGGDTNFKDTDVLGGRLLPANAAKDVFAMLKTGTYKLRATAVPADANAMDEVRARIVVP